MSIFNPSANNTPTAAASFSKTAQVKFARETYKALFLAFDSMGWRNLVEECFSLHYTDEKRHQKGSPIGIKNGLSIKDGATVLTVQRLAGYLVGESKPLSIVDVLDCQPGAIYACAVAIKHADKLREVLTPEVAARAVTLDYADLMN